MMMSMENINKKMNKLLASWNTDKERELSKLAARANKNAIIESKESYLEVDCGDYEIHLTYFPDQIDLIWVWHNTDDGSLEEVFELPKEAVLELRNCFAANLIKYGFYL